MMKPILVPPSAALALNPLRVAALEFPLVTGAWVGLALAPLVFAAIGLGATVAVMDAMSRAALQ